MDGKVDFDRLVEGDSLIIKKGDILFMGIERLGSFLQNNTHIKKLFLVDLCVNDEDAKVLANINLTNLTSLHLKAKNARNMFDHNLIAKALSKALKSSEHPNLTSLHWEVGKFTDPGVVNLSEALKSGSLPNLASFHLGGNKICRYDARALSKALKSGSLPNLVSFHLEGNKIDRFGVEDLSKALESGSLPNLASFHLEGNKICGYGARALSEALKSTASSNQASQHVPLMARSRSSSLSSPDGSNNDQPGPSNRLSEVQPMLSSQLLSFLHSSGKIISRFQCC